MFQLLDGHASERVPPSVWQRGLCGHLKAALHGDSLAVAPGS